MVRVSWFRHPELKKKKKRNVTGEKRTSMGMARK